MMSVGKQKAINNSKTYSNRSFKTNQDSNFICNTCKTSQQDMRNQITQLKQKAHQSFMQVLQIQQLHEEQLTQLKEQWNQKQFFLNDSVRQLQQELRVAKAEMKQLQKNVQRHSYDFGVKELVIDNIEAIGCADQDRSYLDESALYHFKELLTVKGGNDYVASLRKQIYKDFKFVSNNKTQIEKLFMVIKDLKDQNAQLQKTNQINKQKLAKSEAALHSTKATLENLQRENTFISSNLKRLGNDKLTLEKKVSELERKRSFEESVQSPGINRQKSRDSSDKSDKMLEILQEASELSISKHEVNELNYAKFMAPDEVQNSINPIKYNYNMRKNSSGTKQ